MNAEEFKKLSNWEKVRTLSGMFPISGNHEKDAQMLVSRLTLICLISRVEAGDATPDFLEECINKAFGV